MRRYTASRLLKENGQGQTAKNAQTAFSIGIHSVFVSTDMSRDLTHTSFERTHLKSNCRALVLVNLTGNLNMMYRLINIFCPCQI